MKKAFFGLFVVVEKTSNKRLNTSIRTNHYNLSFIASLPGVPELTGPVSSTQSGSVQGHWLPVRVRSVLSKKRFSNHWLLTSHFSMYGLYKSIIYPLNLYSLRTQLRMHQGKIKVLCFNITSLLNFLTLNFTRRQGRPFKVYLLLERYLLDGSSERAANL